MLLTTSLDFNKHTNNTPFKLQSDSRKSLTGRAGELNVACSCGMHTVQSNETKGSNHTLMNKVFRIFKKNKNLSKILFVLLFVLLALLYLFPRFVDVLNQNPLFTFDQGREYLAARSIVQDHKLILIGTELGAGSAGINGIFHGPIYYYFLTIPFVLFGGNPAGSTVLIFAFNLACFVFLYYFVKKMFGFWPAVASAFLFAISPIFISQARFLWSPNPPGVFILASFYFTYLFYKKNNWYTFLAAFFAAFVYNFEMAIAIPLSIVLFLYSIFYFRNRLVSYFYLILGFFVGFLPMFLFEARHDFMGARGIISYLFVKKISTSSTGQNFLADHFNAIIYNLNNTFGIEGMTTGVYFTLPTLLLLGLVIYYLKREKDKNIRNLICYFIAVIVTTFAVFLNLKNALYTYYLTDLSLICLFMFSYVLYAANRNKNVKIVLLLVLFVAYMAVKAIPAQLQTSLYDYKDYGGTAKLKGKIDALDYIYKDANGKPFSLLVFTPPVYTYPYDYVINWYGKSKYGYVPSQNKEGTLYLLMEKDPEKPWSYEGWLETVIKVGDVRFTKTLPSGFIVQKREIVNKPDTH